MGSFAEKVHTLLTVHTSTLAWDFDTLVAEVTSGDVSRVKNIMIRGVYSIDQASEVNSQHGLAAIALMRFPDTVSTPDPDIGESAGAGVDRQISHWRTVWATGQNNPVLWTMKFRAINVKPGEKLILGTRIQSESGASLNHRLHMHVRLWLDDG